MNTPSTVYALSIQEDPYEPAVDFGTYACQELAQQAADFVLANWEGAYKPTASSVRVEPKQVRLELPELHLWYCSFELNDPSCTPRVTRMDRPSLDEVQSNWAALEDPVRFFSCPLRFVAATAQTPEVAEQRARARLQQALDRGALELLSRHEKVLAEAQARFNAENPGADDSNWNRLREIQEAVAKEEFDSFRQAPEN